MRSVDHGHGDGHGDGHLHSAWASEYTQPVAPSALVPGDSLDRDGTAWLVARVDPLDDGTVVVGVQRRSCNGLPGRFRLRLSADTPLVSDGGPPGRRHVSALDSGLPGHRHGAARRPRGGG